MNNHAAVWNATAQPFRVHWPGLISRCLQATCDRALRVFSQGLQIFVAELILRGLTEQLRVSFVQPRRESGLGRINTCVPEVREFMRGNIADRFQLC